MQYKIKSNLLSAERSFLSTNKIQEPIHQTLKMYEEGQDLAGSPFIQVGEWKHHKDCYGAKDPMKAALKRQQAIIDLYHSIKGNGYDGSVMLIWFDDEGYVHLYDGFHRIAIMNYLGLVVDVNVETQWQGLDGSVGKDFPLAEVLSNESPRGQWLYQPVEDDRVKGWKLDRSDSPMRLEYIIKNLTGNTVLDIGCSEGYFSRELAKRGYKVTAIDQSPGLIAAARYLSTIQGLDIDYRVSEWHDMLTDSQHYDNVLFLSILHNDMKKIGVEAGLEKLQAFRGRAERVFFEVPGNTNERQWMRDGFPKFNFHTSLKVLEHNMGMDVKDEYHGVRSVFLFEGNSHKPAKEVFGSVSRDVTYEPNVNGYPMYLFKKEKWITPALVRNHVYEPETTRLVKQWLKEGDVFVDVGANVGYYTVLASKIVGLRGKVYAFEPSSENFKVLQANIELNNCKNVTAYNKALTDKSGKENLFKPDPRSYGQKYLESVLRENKTVGWEQHNTEEILRECKPEVVKAVRLDEALKDAPDVIKVDVEGSEKRALLGMGDLLTKTPVIFLEDTTGLSRWLKKDLGFEVVKHHYERWNSLLRRPGWDVDKWLKSRGTHYKAMFDILRSRKFHNIMEIGTFNGDNAVGMIKTAGILVPEEKIHYYGLDLFEEKTKELVDEEFSFAYAPQMANVAAKIRQQTKAKVTLFKGNTKETLPVVVKKLPKMDFIYIDGGHTIETIRNDWEYASTLIQPGTVVILDDYCDEMPFIGPKFLVGEVDKSRFTTQIMPEVDYYPRPFGRLKAQLLKVEPKQATWAVPKTAHMRFHILGVPHTKTNKDHFICPFTELAYGMCQMMTELGHEVYHYGAEGSSVPCTEHIDVLPDAVQHEAYGEFDWRKHYWKYHGDDLAYTTFAKNAIIEINKRKEPHDLLLTVSGKHHKGISDGVGLRTVEYAVGYEGVFSRYRAFASYAWMHYIYGVLGEKVPWRQTQNRSIDGQWYDAVIPHYFDPSDFEYKTKKGDYFLYMGRLIPRKGAHIAAQTCERIGAKLVVAGQGELKVAGLDKYKCVEYIGTVGLKERSKLLGNARAVFTPTIYIEPFNMVTIEAMLCGTPVITTDWGAFTETVPHGKVGYRCRTMDDFVWAANNVDKIDPHRCREYAKANYSLARVSKMYQEYFSKIQDLSRGGWYEEHPERKELDWLRRY